MALVIMNPNTIDIRMNIMCDIFPAKTIDGQKLKMRPKKVHTDEYVCPICHYAAKNRAVKKAHYDNDEFIDEGFDDILLPKGIGHCPCCGIYILWD